VKAQADAIKAFTAFFRAIHRLDVIFLIVSESTSLLFSSVFQSVFSISEHVFQRKSKQRREKKSSPRNICENHSDLRDFSVHLHLKCDARCDVFEAKASKWFSIGSIYSKGGFTMKRLLVAVSLILATGSERSHASQL